jgi:hypothetical protein
MSAARPYILNSGFKLAWGTSSVNSPTPLPAGGGISLRLLFGLLSQVIIFSNINRTLNYNNFIKY